MRIRPAAKGDAAVIADVRSEAGPPRRAGGRSGRRPGALLLRRPLAALVLLLAALRAAAAPSAEELLRESALRLAAGEVAQARELAAAAARTDPRSARAWQQLAAASNAAQDPAGGREAAERAIALAGESPALLVLRAQAKGGLGDLEGALADTGRALRLAPSSARSRLERARVLEALGRAEEALEDYERAAALDGLTADEARAARQRLAPRGPRRGTGVGGLFAVLGLSALAGWLFARGRGAAAASARSPRTAPPRTVARSPLGVRPLAPREALAALKAAAGEGGPEESYALALALHARLLDRESLPGAETFFSRALNSDPGQRFRNPAELLNAFRALVDPAVH